MRIFDSENNRDLRDLAVFFTDTESKELSDQFAKLLAQPDSYVIKLKGEDVNGKYTKELIIKIQTEQ